MEQAELIIVDALEQLMDFVDNSRIPVLRSGDRMRIVDSDAVADMIADIKTQLPEDIRRANSILLQAEGKISEATEYAERITAEANNNIEILKNKSEQEANSVRSEADAYYKDKVASGDDYLAKKKQEADAYYRECVEKAKQEAERIIDEANAQHEQLVSEDAIVIDAQQRAEELRNKTILRSNQVYNNAKRSADDVFSALLHCLEDYYSAIEQDRKALDLKPQETEIRPQQNAQNHQPAARRDIQQVEDLDDEDFEQDDEDADAPSFFDFFKRKKKKDNYDEDDYI
ncbi:MAG: hypothetical protein II871_07890 [Clostridia bacterium]|nr:hypothetical protein [Clostridia bacterium]